MAPHVHMDVGNGGTYVYMDVRNGGTYIYIY